MHWRPNEYSSTALKALIPDFLRSSICCYTIVLASHPRETHLPQPKTEFAISCPAREYHSNWTTTTGIQQRKRRKVEVLCNAHKLQCDNWTCASYGLLLCTCRYVPLSHSASAASTSTFAHSSGSKTVTYVIRRVWTTNEGPEEHCPLSIVCTCCIINVITSSQAAC